MNDVTSEPRDDGPYREIFELLPAAAVLVGERGRVLLANRAARQLGVDLDSLVRTSRADGTVRLSDGSGAERVLAIDETPFGTGRLLVVRDATEQRALEDELLHLRRVESVGYVTASLVHDFKNLLTPIIATSSLLGEELPRGSRERALANEVQMTAERAASLAGQVLASTARRPARPQAVNVAGAIGEIQWLLERVAGADVTLVVDADDAAVNDVLVDPERLQQALLNLTANARDAMPRGGRLTIRAGTVFLGESPSQGAGDAYVSISVTDTGVGMPPQVRDRIFEPFFTTKTAGRGTGLGLASVRRFVAECGGCVTVRSSVGHGTAVVLYLPCAARPSKNDERAPQSRPIEETIAPPSTKPSGGLTGARRCAEAYGSLGQ